MNNLLSICFLITSILSCIKILSTKSVSSSLTPFLIVIFIGVLLDLIEELKRYRNDRVTNNTNTLVYKSQKFRRTKWNEIKIGNLIKVKCDEIIPADLFVIFSSNPEGAFYLQTASLDGETGLKEREAFIETQKLFLNKKIKKDENNLKNLFHESCEIEVIKPNKNIYEIEGTINYSDENKSLFDTKNIALRGSKLKNTKFIFGIVIYTGKETKVMMNIVKYKSKYAYLDKLVDKIVIITAIIRVVYVLIFMTIGILIRKKYLPKYDGTNEGYDYLFYYRKNENNNNLENVKYFTSHFILSQTILPTSVAFILAIIKIVQSLFIEFLEVPLREKQNEKMKCFSNELLGELGSIKYIFSDKTGTLTKNQTQFKACSIYTSLFDEVDESQSTSIFQSSMKRFSSKIYLPSSSYSNFSSKFNQEGLLQRLNLKNIPLNLNNLEGCPFKSQGEALEEFVLNMALNHDIMVDIDKKSLEIKFQGTNPDEITLVGAAKELGFCYLGKNKNICSVKRQLIIDNNNDKFEIKKYELILKIPFCSERQRSTIIVRDLKTKKIKLYIKGSDTKIFKGINSYSENNIKEITKQHVDDFAKRGLRTLCYSFKTIPEDNFQEWFKKYNKAKENLNKDQKQIDSLIEEIESNCFLLGATALEDQLQDHVEKDIQEFIEAGINVWMLTGDKMDTAESIGHSIKLFDSDTEVFKITGSNQEEIIKRMKEIKEEITTMKEELSKFNINDDPSKKEDINKEVNTLKQKMKIRVENIYGEEKENEEIRIINSRNKGKNFDDNKELSSKRLFNVIEEKKDEYMSKGSQKESVKNMSVFKFMIDEEYLRNSNVEFENLSILRDKVVKPNIDYSGTSDISIGQIEDKKQNNEDIYLNLKNNLKESDLNKDSTTVRENISPFIEITKKKPKIPKEAEISKEQNIPNEFGINKSKNGNEKPKENKNLESLKQNTEYYNTTRRLTSSKKNSRLSINLPTKGSEFLDYFDTCLEKIKNTMEIQQKAFSLFKLPYLYGLINQDVNTELNEGMKKIDWKKKFRLKSYLLHAKIKYSIIISGENINFCTSEGEASQLFWHLIKNSRSVICCRCSPIQKSYLVQFVKNNTKEITLAIGDGDNDVNMIKLANVGIGIFGKEGCQAAFNSDYAISQFKYLKRLLFINGRFTLLRNTYFLNMFFFKNLFYTLQPILFTFYNLYSGTFFYDEFYDSMFNTFVSIIPLIAFSIIDEDIDTNFKNYHKTEGKMLPYLMPDIYSQTRDSEPFNIIKYLICTVISIIYACLVYFFFNYVDIQMIKNRNGHVVTYYEIIFYEYFSIIFIHFFMVYIDTSFFNLLIYLLFVIQIFADTLFIIVFNKISNDNKLSGVVGEIINGTSVFLTAIVACAICCLPFYILRRAELFFGINYSNLIKINKLEAIYTGKYYKKKVEQMITATRAIVKFKKYRKEFLSDKNADKKYDNLNDKKMIKVIEHWEEERKKK